MTGFAFAMAVLAASAVDTTPLNVEWQPVVRVTTSRMTLGSIAHVTPDHHPCAASVLAVDLGPVPLPGANRVLRRSELAGQLRSALPFGSRCDIRHSGAEVVVVSSAGEPVDIDRLRREAGGALRSALAGHFLASTVTPITGGGHSFPVLPGTRFEYSVANADRPYARMPVRVIVREPGHPAWSYPVWFQVQALQRVWLLDEDLQTGRDLAGAHKHLGVADVAPVVGQILGEQFDFSSQAARKPLPAGTALTREMVSRALDVTAGEMISLRFRNGEVAVQTSVLALQSGFKGDRVRVRNVRSDEVVVGRVDGREAVEVRP